MSEELKDSPTIPPAHSNERRRVIELAKCDAARGDPWLRAELRLRKKLRPTPHPSPPSPHPALSRWERVGGADVSAGQSWVWTCHDCTSQMKGSGARTPRSIFLS